MSKFARCPSCSWSQSVGDSVGMPFPCPRCGTLVKLHSGQEDEVFDTIQPVEHPADHFFASSPDIEISSGAATRPATRRRRSSRSVPLEDATRFQRLVAAIIDMAFAIALAWASLLLLNGLQQPPSRQHLYASGGLFSAGLTILIQSYFIAISGQSIGKMLWGLRIANLQDDDVPDFSRTVLIRYWLMLVICSVIPLVGLIDVLCILGRERRCLHDLMAGTRVVQL